jgi:hypothetical protein
MPSRITRSLVAAVVWLAALLVATPVLAQQADVIRGRVFGPDSAPLRGVNITATDVQAQTAKTAVTDARGSFTIVFADGGGSYLVRASLLGYLVQQRTVEKQPNELAFPIVDFRMARAPQTIAPVNVIAEREKPRRDEGFNQEIGAGQTQSMFSLGNVLSGDPTGSIAAALATIPGLTLIPDPNGGPSTVSVLGLGADQNSITLNGMSSNGASVPRDGMVARVTTSSFDPGKGGFSGAQVNLMARGGSNFRQRSLHWTFEDPRLQWLDPTATALGRRYSRGIVSGVVSGPIVPNKAFYNVTYQFGRNSSDLATLLSEDANALQALGVSNDSVARLLNLASTFGIPARTPSVPDDKLSDNGSFLSRIDMSPNATTNLTMTATGNWSDARANNSGPTTLPSYGSGSTNWNLQLVPRMSKYFWRSVLDELSLSFSASQNHGRPYLLLPTGRVLVNSSFDDGSAGSASVLFGGSPSGINDSRSWSSELRNQTSWYTLDSRHQLTLTVNGNVSHSTSTQNGNRSGSFTFNSLSDFAAGRPATFTRTLTTIERNAQSASGLIGFGDVYRPSRRVQVQFGVQLQGTVVPTQPAYNPTIDSLFGRRTDHVPQSVTFAPMLGFSWNVGNIAPPLGVVMPPGQTIPRGTISGGIRGYRGSLNTGNVDQVARQTGLPGSIQQLVCVGDAAPVPDWSSYLQSLGSVPQTCADGTQGSLLSQTTPPVTLFAPEYALSRRWGANLGWQGRVFSRLSGSITGQYSLNRDQPGTFDLNFNPDARFTLGDEGGRPVFVTPASIAAGTGAVSSLESRRFGQFAQVSELRSDLRSEARQLMIGLNPNIPQWKKLNVFGGINYTYQQLRDRSRGFGGVTPGDPRLTVWGRSGNDARHSVNLNTTIRVQDWITIASFGQVRSGTPFSPRVSGDINGDGFSNDLAFVFNPATAPDSTVASGMASLLAANPSAAACLRRQLGSIAARNSCVGPWTSTLNMSVTPDARKLHLPRRLQASLVINNALGAVDRMLHGVNRLHGWGSFAFPDATLLNVRGFDPATNRYLYTVNPRFGSNSAYSASFRAPFSITLDMRMDVGPDRDGEMLKQMLRPRASDTVKVLSAADIKTRLLAIQGRDDIGQVLQRKDSLQLTKPQVDSLTAVRGRLTAKRDSIFTDLSKFFDSLQGNYTASGAVNRWRDANTTAARLSQEALRQVKATLTAQQFAKLPPQTRNSISAQLSATPGAPRMFFEF